MSDVKSSYQCASSAHLAALSAERKAEAVVIEDGKIKVSAKLQSLRNQLDAVPETGRRIWIKVIAARKYVAELRSKAVTRAQVNYAPEDGLDHIENQLSRVIVECRDVASELSAATIYLQTLEDSAAFKEAAAVVEPLKVAIAAQEAADEAAQRELMKAKSAVEEAKRRAVEKALAEAEQAPEVIAAQKALNSCAGKCEKHLNSK
jgi:hypothetical protein